MKNIRNGLLAVSPQGDVLSWNFSSLASSHLKGGWSMPFQNLKNAVLEVGGYNWTFVFHGRTDQTLHLAWDLPEIAHSYVSFTFSNAETLHVRLVIDIEITDLETGIIETTMFFDGQIPKGPFDQDFRVPLNTKIKAIDNIRLVFRLFPGTGSSADMSHVCRIWNPKWHLGSPDEAHSLDRHSDELKLPTKTISQLRSLLTSGGRTSELYDVAKFFHYKNGDIFTANLANISALFLHGLEEGQFLLSTLPTVRHFIYDVLLSEGTLIIPTAEEIEVLTRVQPERKPIFHLPYSILNSLPDSAKDNSSAAERLAHRLNQVPKGMALVKEEIEYLGSIDHGEDLTMLEKIIQPFHGWLEYDSPFYWQVLSSCLINYDRHGYLRDALEEHFGSQTFTSNTRFYKLVANLKYGELRLRTTRAATPRSKNAKRFSSADQKPLRQRAVVFRPYNAYGISRDADQVELMLENNYECDFVTYTEKDAEVYFAPDDQINSDIFFVCADPIRAKKIILKIGREFDGKRCFGIIPWEFSELPAHTVSSLKLFEKILCPSRFCTDTFIDAGLENVSTFPNLLFNTPPSHCRVPDQNQDDQFLFYSHVNLASGINRKNPLGFIRAAREFIANRGGCKFLLRILTSDGSENELEEIMTAANDLPNFVVETSDKDDNNFFHSGLQMADVFVSLHRAEGFGRQIAEAMAVKTSVICTNYSGNLDFCDPQNSYLVDGDLITCEPGDYFENEKQLTWFEPDVRHAAALMQQAISMPQERKQKIEAAYKLVEKKFSVSNEMRQVFMKNLGL